MFLQIYVNAYAGYRANERPKSFELDQQIHEIASIEDRCHEPDAEYFKVRTMDGKTYLLRYDQTDDAWTRGPTNSYGAAWAVSSLRRIATGSRRDGAERSDERPAAIGERDIPAVCLQR